MPEPMQLIKDNLEIILILYVLIIGYYVGKNRHTFHNKLRYAGFSIESALGDLFGWFEEQTIRKKLDNLYLVWWSLVNYYIMLFILMSPLSEIKFSWVIFLPYTILLFIFSSVFLFFEIQFMKEVWGTEKVAETVKAGV